jgi:hypothetical protein
VNTPILKIYKEIVLLMHSFSKKEKIFFVLKVRKRQFFPILRKSAFLFKLFSGKKPISMEITNNYSADFTWS